MLDSTTPTGLESTIYTRWKSPLLLRKRLGLVQRCTSSQADPWKNGFPLASDWSGLAISSAALAYDEVTANPIIATVVEGLHQNEQRRQGRWQTSGPQRSQGQTWTFFSQANPRESVTRMPRCSGDFGLGEWDFGAPRTYRFRMLHWPARMWQPAPEAHGALCHMGAQGGATGLALDQGLVGPRPSSPMKIPGRMAARKPQTATAAWLQGD